MIETLTPGFLITYLEDVITVLKIIDSVLMILRNLTWKLVTIEVSVFLNLNSYDMTILVTAKASHSWALVMAKEHLLRAHCNSL